MPENFILLTDSTDISVNFLEHLPLLKNSTFTQVLITIIVLIIGYSLIKIIRTILKKSLKKSKIDPSLHAFISSTIYIILLVVLALTCLGILGIPTTSIITILGAAGVAVSLALKDSLSNLAGGITILVTKPFHVGNFVEIDSYKGTIYEIGLVYTILKTIDNKRIYIPNSQIVSDTITNYSLEPIRMVDLIINIGYENNIALAKKIILDVIQQNQYALSEPAPIVRVGEHAESSVGLVCRAWCQTDNYLDLESSLLESIKIAFDQNHINIPYKQIDVKIKP